MKYLDNYLNQSRFKPRACRHHRELLSTDGIFLSSDRVADFPASAEVRSPEIVTPSHRSPANRDRSIFGPSACFAPDGPASASSQTTNPDRSIFGPPACFAPDGPAASSSQTTVGKVPDAKAVRDEQLRDLLNTLGMGKRSSSSSTSAAKVDEGSDERASDAAIAKIVEDDVKTIRFLRLVCLRPRLLYPMGPLQL